MITLERVRFVNWHNFEDTAMEIGNRCLLAGYNGSGKSTVIDAIQYAMAANLRMARFNSAAAAVLPAECVIEACRDNRYTEHFRIGNTNSNCLIKDLTNRLEVFKRQPDVNSYLENYKEADRQAKIASAKIGLLKKYAPKPQNGGITTGLS
jgi:predicted ATP-binding protein involved in virulence